jgi:hypothetical protein
MNRAEADLLAEAIQTTIIATDRHSDLWAEVVRILPLDVDPVRAGDDGWDIKVSHLPDFNQCED